MFLSEHLIYAIMLAVLSKHAKLGKLCSGNIRTQGVNMVVIQAVKTQATFHVLICISAFEVHEQKLFSGICQTNPCVCVVCLFF